MCLCAIYGVCGSVFCIPIHTLLLRTRHTKNEEKKRNYSIHWCAEVIRVRTAHRIRGRRHAPCGAVMWGLSANFLSVPLSKSQLSKAGPSPPADQCTCVAESVCGLAGTRSRVWSSRRAGGRRARVVSRRVILLRCLRIRDPTSPAIIYAPEDGCLATVEFAYGPRATRPPVTWHGRGVHNFIQVYLLLAAFATTARRASSRSCARVAALAGRGRRQHSAYRRTPLRRPRRGVPRRRAARTWRVDAGTQLIYSEFIL